MKNVIFLGPPGCGKGTQAELLSSALGYIKVSTGDLLRNIAKQKNALGDKIQAILTQGILVSDDIVNQLIDDFYKESSLAKGIILDGYPRSIAQAKSLELILKKYNTKIEVVFYFDLPEDILVKRITGRYTCNGCGAIYNSFFSNTKLPGKCDKCNSSDFNRRSDDSEAIIVERLKVFKNSTEPLLEYYRDRLIKLNANQAAELLSKQLIEKLQ